MKKIIRLFATVGYLIAWGSTATASSTEVDPEDLYLTLVNNYRKKKQLSAVETSTFIQDMSHEHSRDMAEKRKIFGHDGLKDRCAELRNRLKGTLCGEIVARGQKTSKDAFRAWINSAGHRAIIEGKGYTHTGLGYYQDANGVMYWTQMFLKIK